MELAADALANYTNASTAAAATNYSHANPAVVFGPKRDSLYIVVPITVMYVAIFVSGLFGNVCTCIVITRNKCMHTATNYYLFSLAVSDLLLLVCGLPQEIYWIWSKWPYVFGESFCVLRGLAAETSTNASVLTITSFTVERYVAICHPFLSHTMSKLSRAIKHILLVWLVSLAFALPQALQFGLRDHLGVVMCLQTKVIVEHSFEISTFLFFFAPMVLITALYALIGLRLSKTRIKRNRSVGRRRSAAALHSTAAAPGTPESEAAHFTHRAVGSVHKRHGQSTRRVVKMLVAVVTAFFLCWAPFHAQRLVAIYGTSANHQARSPAMLVVYAALTYCSGVMYYLSTAVNPVLYHIMSNKFREAFKSTVAECCGRGALRAARAGAYSPMVGRRNTALSSTDNSGNSVRDETTRFSHATLKQQNSNKSLIVRNYSASTFRGLTAASADHSRHSGLPKHNPPAPPGNAVYRPCSCNRGTNERYHEQDKENRWTMLNCAAKSSKGGSGGAADDAAGFGRAPEPEAATTTPGKLNLRGTISNSSLREAAKRDLEDELNSYMEELRGRQLFQ